jgi:hypothetical protein
MAISTKNTRQASIGKHPQDLGKKALLAISTLNVAVNDALEFSAYMNSPISVLDIDSEDRFQYSKIFRDAVISLAPVLASLARLQALDDESVSKADFIADMEAGGLVLAEYAAQFK